MGLDPKPILDEIDAVLAEVRGHMSDAAALRIQDRMANRHADHSDTSAVTTAFSLLADAVRRYAPPGSDYVARARAMPHMSAGECKYLMGFLTAIRSDYASGRHRSIVELLHAETFSDYLDMASHLLEEGYKDPAAVLAGSTLEAHVKALAIKHRVRLEETNAKGETKARKLDTVSADLVKANAYDKNVGKSVTDWAGLRNDAAHGDYGKYDATRVRLMVEAVRHFISTHPA